MDKRINCRIILFTILACLTAAVNANSYNEETAVLLAPHHATNPHTYIVQLVKVPTAAYLVQNQLPHDGTSMAAQTYRDQLAAEQDAVLNQIEQILLRPVRVQYRYDVALNGFALVLTGEEAAQITRLPEVQNIWREKSYTLATDTSPQFVQATAVWDGSGTFNNIPNKGEGIQVGIIDTGINTDHPAFQDVGADGYNHSNPLGSGIYKGICVSTPALCNDKLIGLWDFVDGVGESDGAEDSNGHGSHTASTAAGNVATAHVTTPSYSYTSSVSGIAPHANIIAYDACILSCPGSALLAAVNQAVADGVDVINYSISGGTNPYDDPISLAFLVANDAGIFVAASAGNEGPDAGTVSHISPWVTAVSATTHDRHLVNSLVNFTSTAASPPANLIGSGLTAGYGPARIVSAADAGDAGCLQPFQPGTWRGQIVVCERGEIARVDKGLHLLTGGAGGMILINGRSDAPDLPNDAHYLPTVHISYADGIVLKAWLAVGSNHRGRIAGTAVSPTDHSDIITSFSSRGPNTLFDLLKPDIAAPGVDILAALHSSPPFTSAEYGFLSGTSMAAPHVAGAAALLKAANPTWTPDEIRAALMMSSSPTAVKRMFPVTAADPFDVGAGRLDLSAAAKAGLVLHETRTNYEAANPLIGGEPAALNLPSLMHSTCFQTCGWTRTVRSTLAAAATWTVAAVTDTGLQVGITPTVFTLPAGNSQAIQFTADVNNFFDRQGWAFGSITLTSPGQEPLHMPVAVNKVMADAPAQLTKSGSDFAHPNQIITYSIRLDNLDTVTHTLRLTDTLPAGVSYVPNSATGGLAYDGANHRLTWQGDVGPGQAGYTVTAVPAIPYINLGDLVNPPDDLCQLFSTCDEATVIFNLGSDSITFFDETLTKLNVSTNGIIFGPNGLTGAACIACPQPLPNPAELNEVIAGLWRDIDMSGGSGEWYGAILTGLLDNPADAVFYANWHDAAQFANPALTARHAIAIVLDGQSEPAGRIYVIVNGISDPEALIAAGYTIGVENAAGSSGVTVAFAPCSETPCILHNLIGAPPPPGTTLRFDPATVGGAKGKLFTYQVLVTAGVETLLSNEVVAEQVGSGVVATAVADTWVAYRTYLPFFGKAP